MLRVFSSDRISRLLAKSYIHHHHHQQHAADSIIVSNSKLAENSSLSTTSSSSSSTTPPNNGKLDKNMEEECGALSRLQASLEKISPEDIKHKFSYIKRLEDDRLHDAITQKSGSSHTINHGVKAFKSKRNRYTNILPYDSNRVRLANTIKESDDYINASYINMPSFSTSITNQYIATQGPTKTTLAHFWSMVFQESGPNHKDVVILMLTPLVENNTRKCSLYWCDTEEEFTVFHGSEYGLSHDLKLLCQEVKYDYEGIPGLRYSTLQLSECGEEDATTTVHHLYFDNWSDFDKPQDWEIIYRLSRVAKRLNVDALPLITHCSAGVGRTGTFITLDYLFQNAAHLKIGNGQDVIFETVMSLREQRMSMVQSFEQYRFLYDTLQSFVDALLQ